jgi:hypothetical protein
MSQPLDALPIWRTRCGKTPLWDEVGEAYDPKKERLRVRDPAVDIALQVLK